MKTASVASINLTIIFHQRNRQVFDLPFDVDVTHVLSRDAGLV